MISNKQFLASLEEEMDHETGIHSCYEKYCKNLTLDDLFTTDSVYMAACHCACGFRGRNDTDAFMSHAWLNSMLLAEQVRSGKFRPSYYRSREITERGKRRTIRPPKFECKVVQKVLCDLLLRTLLEPKMISTSYASRRGKGIDRMFSDILHALRCSGEGCVLVQTDFSSYFPSIDAARVCDTFRSWGMDEDVVSLFQSFGEDGFSLGNETSQIPASWYASVTDHELKDKCRFQNVFRFMDDMLVIAENPERAEEALFLIRETGEKLGLTVKEQKVHILRWGEEFVFCKGNFFFNKRDKVYYWNQNPKVLSNETRKLSCFEKKLQNGEMTKEEIHRQLKSVIGSMEAKPNTKKAVRKLRKREEEILFSASKSAVF